MIQDETGKLAIWDIFRETYAVFFTHLKSHVILSYLYSLPIGFFVLGGGLDLSSISPGHGMAELDLPPVFWGFIVVAFLWAAVIHLLYFRLYLLGRDRYLSFSLPDLGRMVVKFVLYSVLFILLLFIFMLSANMVIGLVTLIFSALTGGSPLTTTITVLSGLAASVFLFIIALRMLPTFASIAENARFLPFRESWYYTRGEGLKLVFIYLTILAPAWFVVFLTSAAVTAVMPGDLSDVSPSSGSGLLILQLLLSPVGVAPGALIGAATTRVYCLLVR